jgi:hypothetical protein
VIGAPPFDGAVHDTNACELAGLAATPDGAPGTVVCCTLTLFEAAETGPAPAEFDACTVKV